MRVLGVLVQLFRLSFRDFTHERLLSACGVLGLAAVLAPLLVLYGVKFGIVETLTDRLRQDPRTLEVSPVSSGRYTADYLAQLAAHPDVAFVLPRTRAIAATMDLTSGQNSERKTSVVSLEPTAANDPLLIRYGVKAPTAGIFEAGAAAGTSATPVVPPVTDAVPTPKDIPTPQASPVPQAPHIFIDVVLSASAAEKLAVRTGDELMGKVERRYNGRVQSARVALRVSNVLPVAAQQKDTAYVPLPLLEATEDYRDGRAVPELGAANGWVGEARPEGPRVYPGFRLHAAGLESVARLRTGFAAQGIDVYTRAEDIEQIDNLSQALNLIFGLICGAAAAGFLASTAGQALAGVKRKERILGLLRLMGFSTFALVCFPLLQALLTASLGLLLASGLYAAAASVINHLFSASLMGVEQVCLLLPRHWAAATALIISLSLAAVLGPALRAARIEPSEVIRDV